MKKIKLNTGKYALVDDEDFTELNQFMWYEDTYGYAVRKPWVRGGKGKSKLIKMHRVVMGITDKNIHIDHVNRNGLDNRKKNLRKATRNQNQWNCGVSKNNKSGYKGVCLDKRRGTWKAEIMAEGKKYYLGAFKTPEEAARAWNEKAKELHGEFAFQNKIRRNR